MWYLLSTSYLSTSLQAYSLEMVLCTCAECKIYIGKLAVIKYKAYNSNCTNHIVFGKYYACTIFQSVSKQLLNFSVHYFVQFDSD